MQARGNDMFIFQGGDPDRLLVYSKGRLIVLKTWDGPLGISYLGGMTVLGDNVYFLVYRNSNSSNELWRSDGSVDGTIKIASFTQTILSIPIGPLVSTDKLLFFKAYGQIYQSTGAIGNLELIDGNYSMHPYRSAFVSTGSAVYFVSDWNYLSVESDLYMTTGKEGGIQKLINNVYEYLIPINGRVYFYSYDSLTRTFIGRSDGTQAGTEICKPISGSYSALFYDVVEVGGKVYFLGRNPENSTEIWTSDNIQAGCQPIASQYPGAQKDSTKAFTRAWLSRTGSHLLFVGNNGLSGFELMGYKVLQDDIFLPRIGR
jgi:ELWxxDGT repeat protein